MSSNKKSTNTSIELVSNSGPLPINVMMQEGVKALTKILSNQLQDRKAFENAQHSMQFVVRNNSRQFVDGVNSEQASVLEAELDIDDEGNSNNNNNRNNNTENQTGKKVKPNNSIHKSEVHEFMDEDLLNPALHLDGEEAEIIFDYETHDDSPDAIGKRISEMIESVLPNGFTADAQGQLHAVINGNELNITELDNGPGCQQGDRYEYTASRNHNKIEEIVHDNSKFESHPNIDINTVIEEGNEDVDNDKYDDDDDDDDDFENDDDDTYDHESCCPHHGPGSHHQNPQRFKNYNYHDFDYMPRNIGTTKRRPDFSVLIEEDRPMCMFCEYYMVFGEPPKNMIKWYNNMFGYNRLPPAPNRDRHQHNHHHHQQGQRKRNR